MKFSSKLVSALAPFIAAAALSGCNAGGESSLAGNVTQVTTLTSQTPADNESSAPKLPVGESCVSDDPNHTCLALHFVTYKDSSGKAAASEAQAATIVSTMNKVFAQCKIGFQIEKYEAVDPTAFGLAYGSQSQNELNQIRETFSTEADMLLGVTTGPWGSGTNGWTNMPGSNVYGAVMEASIVDYNEGLLYAHEFGHYLGLGHPGDASNLMNATIYATSTNLTTSQCAAAQETIASYWPRMIRQ